MSHEPGREAHMTHACEECRRIAPLEHYGFCDAYLCEECAHRLIKLFEEQEESEEIIILSLDDPEKLHNAIADAVGERKDADDK